MPLVFTENERIESGHVYADRTGISYEYPHNYRNMIRTGERFVYYMGRRRAYGQNAPQVYFGTGLVGEIRPSSTPGRLECQISDYRPFERPIPFKREDGSYRESRATTQAGYFRNGVRQIDNLTFDGILLDASIKVDAYFPATDIEMGYANSQTRIEVELYSVHVALELTRAEHPGASVLEMPHNNPGYDLRVGPSESPMLYVEVKGTQRNDPVFFISEGERAFAENNAQRYRIIVVHAIDLFKNTHRISLWNGALEIGPALVANQWRGRLPT